VVVAAARGVDYASRVRGDEPIAQPRLRPAEAPRFEPLLATLAVLLGGAALEVALRMTVRFFASSAVAPSGILASLGLEALLALPVAGVVLLGNALVRGLCSARGVSVPLRLVVPALILSAVGSAVAAYLAGALGTRTLLECGSWLAAALALALGWRRLRRRRSPQRVFSLFTAWALAAHLLAAWSGPLFHVTRWSRYPPGPGSGLPSVMILSIDTLRADRLGAYGYSAARTPSIDRLAREGTLFERGYSHAPWTRPAFGSLLASAYPSEHGAYVVKSPEHATERYVGWSEWLYDGSLKAEAVTLAETLHSHGYFTLALQSNENVSARYGFDQGFDAYLLDELHAAPLWRETLPGRAWRRIAFWEEEPKDPAFPSNEELYRGLTRFLDDGGLDRPSFVWLNFLNVHSPYDLRDPGDPLTTPIRETYRIEDLELTRDQLSRGYDSEVALADAYVGLVVESLRKRGLLERTLLIVTSDHGEELGDHGVPLHLANGSTVYGRFHGHSLYREQLHVPLLLRLPGRVPEGARLAAPAQQLDVAPTVLDLLGLPPVPEWRGDTLRPLLEGGASPAPKPIFAERPLFGPDSKAVIAGERKAIWSTVSDSWEIFDLASDPRERRPLREPPGYADLRSLLVEFARLHPGDGAGCGASDPSPEKLEQLRALGYAGVSASRRGPQPCPTP